jgi:hypothetical protein
MSDVGTGEETTADDRDAPAQATRRGLLARSWRTLLPFVLVAGFAAALLIVFIHRYPTVGPIDELQHVDYAEKISRGDLVEQGDKFGQVALREESCRGIDSPGMVLPSCDDAHFQPEAYQEGGFNTAAGHPPVYYLVTGLGARALQVLPGIDSFLLGARLMGVFWLVGGLVVLWLLLRELRVRPLVAAAIGLFVVCIPSVFYFSAVVNNDAAALMVGSGVAWVGLRFVRGTSPLWLFALVCALAQGVKYTNIVVIGIVVATILTLAYLRRSDPAERKRLLVGAAAAIGAALVVTVAWQGLLTVTAKVPGSEIPMTQRFLVKSISVNDVLRQSLAGFPPTQNPYIPKFMASVALTSWVAIVGWIVIAGPTAAALRTSGPAKVRAMSVWTLVAMLTTGSFFTVLYFVQMSTYTDIPSRYGLVMVPVALAGLATCLRDKGAQIAMGGLAVLGAVIMLSAVI